MLLSQDETTLKTARHLGSRLSQTPPQLTIDFTVPPPETVLTNVRRNGAEIEFSFDSEPGWVYQVEQRDQLVVGGWTVFRRLSGGSEPGTIRLSIPLEASQRFFRVVAE